MPISSRRFFRSSPANTSRMAELSRATMAGGVPARTNRPFHAVTSKPLAPASFAVGTFGSSGERIGADVASGPQLAIVEIASERRVGVYAHVDVAAQQGHEQVGELRNGTHWNSIPAVDFRSSAERCWVLPGLIVPTLSFPGLSRAASSTSASERYGEAAFAAKKNSNLPILVTGAKSVSGLNVSS
jgi:hypothetical protein